MKLYRIQQQWWVDALLSKRMGNLRTTLSAHDLFNTNIARGSYLLDMPVLAFERNWHGPRLQLTLSYSWVGERQGAGCLDINDYL